MEIINSTQETPIPKQNNIFRYLFIICFIVLLISVTSLLFIVKNLNSKLELTKQANNFTETIPTIIPIKVVDEATPVVTETIVKETIKEYNGTYFSLNYPNNWIETIKGQVFFHPKGTIINEGVLPDAFFRIWESDSEHGGPNACYSSIDNIEPKKETVVFNNFKGIKCYGSKKGTSFVFTFPETKFKGQVWFEFSKDVNEDLVNQVMDSFKID